MKLFLSLTAVLSLVAIPALAVETDKICPPEPETAIPLYRVENHKHDYFYSTDTSHIKTPNAGAGGYKRKESVGNIFNNQPEFPGTIPLHRLYFPGRTGHTYAVSPSDMEAALKMGYHDEGVIGSLVQYGDCASAYPGFKVAPLYRLHNKKTNAYLLTHDDADRAALKSGYGEATILGYVLIPL